MQKCVEYCKKKFQNKLEFFNWTQVKYEFLTIKNIKIHIKFMFCLKKLIFLGDIIIILWIFLQNFIQKYEFYIWVCFKGGTKSEDEKNLGTKSWRKFLVGLKLKVGIFIGTKNIFNPSKYIVILSMYVIHVTSNFLLLLGVVYFLHSNWLSRSLRHRASVTLKRQSHVTLNYCKPLD